MQPIKVFAVIRRRRLVFFGAIIGVFFIASVMLLANFFASSKRAKAVDFEASTNKLVVPQDEIIYIGSSGYTSQRFYSSAAEPINLAHQLSQTGSPADHVYNTQVASVDCPGAAVWGNTFASGKCRAIVGDGTGMILKYSQSIDIYGTVVIGDRIAFDSSSINIYSSGKIYANGQDGQLGFGGEEHWNSGCGAGGIGGINGGTNASSLSSTIDKNGVILQYGQPATTQTFMLCRSDETQGMASTDPALSAGNLKTINNIVKSYFVVNSDEIIGGTGANSSLPSHTNQNTPAGVAPTPTIGVGSGGAGGSTGASYEADPGASGGAGGGFGLVFKSNYLSVNISAIINASGGNSPVSDEATMQYRGHNDDAAGAFGGAGGGGVIIIDSPSINFASGDQNSNPAIANYSIFNTKQGQFKLPNTFGPGIPHPEETLKAPPTAADGKLVVNAGSGIVSIKKSVVNCGTDLSCSAASQRPNYVFRPGDNIIVTIDVANLTPGNRYTIDDEIFSDGINLGSTVNAISDGGSLNGLKVTWSLLASANSKTLRYKLVVQ